MKHWLQYSVGALILAIVCLVLCRQALLQQWADKLNQHKFDDEIEYVVMPRQQNDIQPPKLKPVILSVRSLPLPLIKTAVSPEVTRLAEYQNKIGKNSGVQQAEIESAIQTTPTQANSVQQDQSAQTEKLTTSDVYKKLSEDKTLSIELMLPNNPQQRAQLFSYFYECAGVAFGVFNDDRVEVLSNSRQQDYSHWLRVAQGELNYREIKWLRGGNIGRPVRLFPKELDWQLSHQLSQHLNGRPLESLLGEYYLNQAGVHLRNISINGERLGGHWLLANNNCSA
ncbi:hypothetical protein QX776_03265 [Alteromonadaceae bacterium BrNp21-10]|nr:hypothetical protein [Alteromonadaceae bacterium BrNp21-10]